MINEKSITRTALSFAEVIEEPHFQKSSFRVIKKIFASLDLENKTVVLKLSELDQSVLSAFGKSIIYPVNGKWGRKGWTVFEFEKLKIDMFKDALTVAYCTVAPKRLSEIYSTR